MRIPHTNGIPFISLCRIMCHQLTKWITICETTFHEILWIWRRIEQSSHSKNPLAHGEARIATDVL